MIIQSYDLMKNTAELISADSCDVLVALILSLSINDQFFAHKEITLNNIMANWKLKPLFLLYWL